MWNVVTLHGHKAHMVTRQLLHIDAQCYVSGACPPMWHVQRPLFSAGVAHNTPRPPHQREVSYGRPYTGGPNTGGPHIGRPYYDHPVLRPSEYLADRSTAHQYTAQRTTACSITAGRPLSQSIPHPLHPLVSWAHLPNTPSTLVNIPLRGGRLC